MLDLLEAVKTTIEKFIIGRVTVTSDLAVGQTTIPVNTSRRFVEDDHIVIFQQPTENNPTTAEKKIITSIPDSTSIVIDEPLTTPYQNATIERQVYNHHVNGVYLGNPPTIPSYPAITIEAITKNNEWSTLGCTSETFPESIDYIDASDGNTPLKAARLTYSCTEEVLRQPDVDPVTY